MLGVLGANQEKNVWKRLEVVGDCGNRASGDRLVTCPDLTNYNPGFTITEPGDYHVQIMVVHKRRVGTTVFSTDWAKTEYVSLS